MDVLKTYERSVPNDKHPGPNCSCRDCLRRFPGQPLINTPLPRITREEFHRLLEAYTDARALAYSALEAHGFQSGKYFSARDKSVEAQRALEQAVFGDAT